MKRPNFNWKLPAAIETRLGTERYGSKRAIFEEGHLLLILHHPPGDSWVERDPAVFLRKPDSKWWHQGVDNGEYILNQLLERYRALLGGLEVALDKAATADALFQILDQGIPLARAAGNMKEALQSAREAVKQDQLLIDSRDRAVDIARGLELLLSNARLALDYRLARNAEEQVQAAMTTQRAQHKLNVLAAWTLPLITVATMFGMNLLSGLENLSIFLFWGVFLGGLVLGMMAKTWVEPRESGKPQLKPGRETGKTQNKRPSRSLKN